MIRCTLVIFMLVAPPLLNAATNDAKTLRNTDVFELEYAADPRLSPDGRTVVYERRSSDIMTDRARSSLWSVSRDGSAHRPLLADTGSYSSPRFSPDGSRLAYVAAAGNRGAQIFVRYLDSGQTALLTNLLESPAAISWSPDGLNIAFTMHVERSAEPLATPPKTPEGAEWAPPVTVIEDMNYRADGAGYLAQGNTHLFVVPADGGTPRQLTSGDFNHSGPLSWSAGGDRIYFSANRNDDWEYQPMESELWSVDLANGELRRVTERNGPDFAPVVSPNGRMLAWLGFDDRGMGYHNARVYVMNTDGSNRRLLTEALDRSVADVQWAGSDSALLIQYDDHGKTVIARLNMNGDVETLVEDVSGTSFGRPYTSGGFAAGADGSFVYTRGSTQRPADVAAADRRGRVTTLTALNEDLLGWRDLATVEKIQWSSPADGLPIEGWLMKPPGFDAEQRYPLILEIHGGPFAAYGPHFSVEAQLYAAAGYVVLYTNPRGSTSYGAAFANEIHLAYPGQDYDDLMSGVDAALAQGYIDEDQLFVTGGSGGGVLTAWIVGKTDRFAAAAVAKPVINWTSMTLTADISAFVSQYWFAAKPWEAPDAYWARSPLSLVGNVTTPTMLLTGEQDWRTPISESEQYYQALHLQKVDTALVRIPEASHGIAARPSHLIAKVDNILGWFGRYRK